MSHSPPRRGFTIVELLVVVALIGILIALVLPARSRPREHARRAQCVNNLKQIGQAFGSYHNAHGCFPPSSTQEILNATKPVPGSSNADGGGAGFSWQVMLLPYVERNNLFEKLTVTDGFPYDGSNDHKLVAAETLHCFRCLTADCPDFAQASEYPKDSSALSNYVAIGATHLASLYRTETRPIGGQQHPNGVMYPGSKTSRKDITDGEANTVIVCETTERDYSAWTDGTTAAVVGLLEASKPTFEMDTSGKWYVPTKGVRTTINCDDRNTPYLMADSHSGSKDWCNGPSSHHTEIVNHLFADGSVRAICDDIDPAIYMHLISRAGGEPVKEYQEP